MTRDREAEPSRTPHASDESSALDALRELDVGDVVALTTPGFETAPAQLGLLSADALHRLFASPATSGGRAGTHSLVTAAGAELMLRPFRRGGLLGRLGRSATLRSPRRWFDEIRVTHELRQRGAPVPQPAFAIACRPPGEASRGWEGAVASVRVPGAVDAASYARSPAVTEAAIAGAAAACGRAVRAFHDCGGRHADLHAGNLLVSATGHEAWVIDLDRGRAGSAPSPRRRARELARLTRSIEKLGLREHIGDAGFRSFVDAYGAGDPQLAAQVARAWRTERLAILPHRIAY